VFFNAVTRVQSLGDTSKTRETLPRHFIQHGCTPRLLHVNRVLFYEPKNFEPTATVIDIPSEKDANIVSKRIAELVCGVDTVPAFSFAMNYGFGMIVNSRATWNWSVRLNVSLVASFRERCAGRYNVIFRLTEILFKVNGPRTKQGWFATQAL
jgi:hypothetical protein